MSDVGHSAESGRTTHAALMEAMLASWDDEPTAAEIELCSTLASNVLPVIQGERAAALRDAALAIRTSPRAMARYGSYFAGRLDHRAEAEETRATAPVEGTP